MNCSMLAGRAQVSIGIKRHRSTMNWALSLEKGPWKRHVRENPEFLQVYHRFTLNTATDSILNISMLTK